MSNDTNQGDDDDVVIDIPSNDVTSIESPLLLSSQQHQPVTTTKVEFANLMLLSPSVLTSSSTTLTTSNYDYTTAPILTFATSSSSSYPNTASSIDQQQQSQQEVVVVLQARLETCHDLIAAAAAAAAAQQQQSIESTNQIHVDNNNTSQPQHVTPITHIQGVVDLDILSEIAGVSRSDFLTDWQQQQPQSHLEDMNDDNKYVNECNEATPLLLSSAATTSSTITTTGTTPQQQVTLYTPEIVPYHDTTGINSIIHNNNNTLSPISTQNHKRQNVVLTDTVLLNADAFVETLSDVLENHNNNNNNNGTTIGGGTSTMNQQKQLISPYHQPINHNNDNDPNDDIESLTENYDTCSATNDNNTEDDNYSGITPGGAFFVPRPENLGANLSSNQNNIKNTLNRNHTHAFLLEIPSLQMMIPPSSSSQNEQQSNIDSYNSTTTTITPPYIKSQLDIPSHFILAFPPDSSNNNLWQDDVSDASMDNNNNNNNNNNDDDSFLLGLSHLPTDVCDVQIEAIQYNSNYYNHYNSNYDNNSDDINNNIKINDTTTTTNTTILRLDVVVKRQVPFIGYVILIGGLLSLSSVGTALNLQQNVTPIMKSFWRYTCTWIILLPIAIRSIVRHGYPQLVQEQWLYFIICSICYAFMTTAFVSALEYTTLANAFVLSNLAPLFIIVGRYIYGLPILYMEGIGSMIGFIGGSICAFDVTPTLYSNGIVHDHPYALLGDSLAVMASLAVAIYLLLAKKLRPHIDLFVFSFLLMLTSSIFVLFYMIITKEPMSFSNDINYGLWGWMNCQLNRLPLELYMAIVCNIFGTTGYIAVMKYFEPIVVSTVMLSEPVVGALLAAAVGSDPLPGIQTWIGNIIVAIGIFLVVWSGARSTETIDATKALLQVNSNNNNNPNNNSNDNGLSNGISVSSYNDNNGMNYNNNQMGVPLLKNHPVTAAWNSPHRLKPPTNRMRNESIHSE